MSLAELQEELDRTSDSRKMISLLNTILGKSFGQNKLEFMKQLVQLYKETRMIDDFLELAPQVLK